MIAPTDADLFLSCHSPNVGLKPAEAYKRLEWWLRAATASGEEDAVSRRVALVARSGLGQF